MFRWSHEPRQEITRELYAPAPSHGVLVDPSIPTAREVVSQKKEHTARGDLNPTKRSVEPSSPTSVNSTRDATFEIAS
jgi:hypothetical protein